MDNHQQTFLEEARELLTDLEDALLAIENEPENMELIGRIFRAMHTIKGSSSMFGFTVIAAFAHQLENAFDCVREGKMRITPSLITLTLASRDHIANLLDCAELERQPDAAIIQGGEGILQKLQTMLPASEVKQQPVRTAQMPDPSVHGKKQVFRIRFKPSERIYLTGSNPQYLIDEVKELGDCDVVLHSDAVPPPEEANPDLCYFRWDLLLASDRDEKAIRDVFIFVEDESEIRVELLGDASSIDAELRQDVLDTLRKTEDAPLKHLQAIVAPHKVKPDDVAPAGEQQKEPAHADHKGIQNIKVPAERLDKLVDLVGELVIAQARLSQMANGSGNANLLSISEQVESLVWELRDNAMSIRMLPIGMTFGKFRRLVRDLSGELGKDIELLTEGEETELDKTVIERLGDPLVHMIRNSVDHGIETPDERQAAGKPRSGTVRLSAAHVGASVHIAIADDGKGLDLEAIRKKGIDLGMIPAEGQVTDQELYALIFKPGFSTAHAVTSVSGRGVGMDVVRRGIEELGGQIEVSSKLGKGTTITLKLPLTLAIVEGLLVEVASDLYILPLSIVKECVELPEEKRHRVSGGELINVRGEIVPYIRLREFYEKPGDLPQFEYIVIVEVNNTQVGFAVDAVRGQHQTVIKALGAMYRDVKGVSGATILGDGTVALIVDVPAVFTKVLQENNIGRKVEMVN